MYITDRAPYVRVRSHLTTIDVFLPSAKEVCEGYVFTGVCLSTGEWEGSLPHCMLGYTPPPVP